jgi:hypothetical protein
MKRFLILLIPTILYFSICKAQGFGYDNKTDIGNGLYKVKSGESYGIIDKNDNVVVSIEFQDILFKQGKALLTKNDILYGVVDSLGVVKVFDTQYKVHPNYRYIYDGFIIIGNTKWGFITENGEPLRVKSKLKSFLSLASRLPTMFDDVAPFVDGYAAVYLKKSGWKHIDKNGVERYTLGNKKAKALFRSSVYKGECIIVTNEGIKQYQENSTSQAVVKRVLSSSVSTPSFIQDSSVTKLTYQEGILTLDSLMRVSKFETGTDSIVFIEKPRKVVVKKVELPIDTLSLKEDLKVELVYKNLQANEHGKAYTEIKLVNTSNDKFDELSVVLECVGATREWNGSLSGNSEVRISFNVPARFSSTSIKRNILIDIGFRGENIELEYPVTINRYTPVRSR